MESLTLPVDTLTFFLSLLIILGPLAIIHCSFLYCLLCMEGDPVEMEISNSSLTDYSMPAVLHIVLCLCLYPFLKTLKNGIYEKTKLHEEM